MNAKVEYPERRGYRFSVKPPKGVSEALKSKVDAGDALSFDYRDVYGEEHVAAWTVAKATEYDVRQTIREATQRAIDEGVPFKQFVKELQPKLEKMGWWGVKEVTDLKTGETQPAQLGSMHRLRTIYKTNLRMAQAAGQWQRIQETKRALPYLLRQLGSSKEHRPEHVRQHGVLLDADDPYWLKRFPPDDYGCNCWVRQVSRAERERLVRDGIPSGEKTVELDPKTGRPTGFVKHETVKPITEAPPEKLRTWYDKRRERTLMLPEGVGPGFDYNPGEVRLRSVVNKFNRAKGLTGGDALEQSSAIVESNLRQRHRGRAYLLDREGNIVAESSTPDQLETRDVVTHQHVLIYGHQGYDGSKFDELLRIAERIQPDELRMVDEAGRHRLRPAKGGLFPGIEALQELLGNEVKEIKELAENLGLSYDFDAYVIEPLGGNEMPPIEGLEILPSIEDIPPLTGEDG